MSENTVEIVIRAKNLAASTMKKTASMITKTIGGAVKKLAKSLTSLKTLAITAFAGWGLKKLAGGFLETAMSTERYKVILETVLKSAAKAKEYFQWISNFAASTPFEIPGLMEAATRLEAYQLNAKKYLRTLGDTAASMGKPIMAAVEMIADASQGEFERLKEFGFRAADVAKRAGFETVQVMNSTRQNLIKATETLMIMLNERYAGGMKKLSGTLGGMFSTIRDYYRSFQQMIMDSGVFDFIKGKVASILETLNRLKAEGKMKEWAENIGQTIVSAFNKGWRAIEDLAKKIRELYHSGLLQAWAGEAKEIFKNLYTFVQTTNKAIEFTAKLADRFRYRYLEDLDRKTGISYFKFEKIKEIVNDLATPIEIPFQATMSGSTKLPFSEKITELKNKVTDFHKYVSDIGTNYVINASGATQALSSALESVNANYENKLQNMISYVAARQTELADVSRGHKPYMFGTYRNILKGQIETGMGLMENTLRQMQTEQKLTAKYYGGNATFGPTIINLPPGTNAQTGQDWRDIVRRYIIPEMHAAGAI